jgi:hypothetical protein
MLNDTDYLIAAGAGMTLASQSGSLPLAVRYEMTVSDYVFWARTELAPSLGFRPPVAALADIVALAAHAPAEVGAAEALRCQGAQPVDGDAPRRPVNASSPAPGELRADITGTELDGDENASPDLLRVARWNGAAWESVDAQFAADGGGYKTTGLAAGNYVLYVVDSASGKRSAPTPFVSVS